MTCTDERFAPFAYGIQATDWAAQNCRRCAKHTEYPTNGWLCPVEQAIDLARLDDGTVSREMAERMGHTPWLWEMEPYVWDCPERVLREEVLSAD